MKKYFGRKSFLCGVPILATLAILVITSNLNDSSRYERLPEKNILNDPNSVKNSIEYKVGRGFWKQ